MAVHLFFEHFDLNRSFRKSVFIDIYRTIDLKIDVRFSSEFSKEMVARFLREYHESKKICFKHAVTPSAIFPFNSLFVYQLGKE